jgi:integrase
VPPVPARRSAAARTSARGPRRARERRRLTARWGPGADRTRQQAPARTRRRIRHGARRHGDAEYGLAGLDDETVTKYKILCGTHVIPALGARKLRDLSADDVDRWLVAKSRTLSTSTLQVIRSCLNRTAKRAMARDKVKRNVVELCAVPAGRAGRPSKALTVSQAEAVLTAAAGKSLHAYIVVALLTGERTEELRALKWDHVFLKGDPDAVPAVPPHIAVWRSVRTGGDTKTRKSRRTLALPARCVEMLRQHGEAQHRDRAAAGDRWEEHGLVFTSRVGTELDAANVRRSFRRVLAGVKGLDASAWTPRELRHSFVSLLSDSGVPRTSPGWSATPARLSRRGSTGSRSDR